MNKNLRLSLITVACSLAITACSSDNKGATRYENLVNSKAEETAKKAEEAAKRAQESATAKKLADLEQKQKELEAELAKKNGNAAVPSVGSNVPSNLINPSTPAKAKDTEEKATEKKEPTTPTLKNTNENVLTPEDAKKALENAFKDNGLNNEGIIKLSGSSAEFGNAANINNIASDSGYDLNTLMVDGKKVELFSNDFIKESAKNDSQVGIKEISNNAGKVGSLPSGHLKYDFEQMRYGYYKTDDGNTILFVQGYMTPENSTNKDKKSPFNYYSYYSKGVTDTVALSKMPTEHTYEYQGKAFYGKDNSYQELNSKAYADFTHKKVQITLSDSSNQDKFTFGAKINGNQFSGTVDGIVTKGAFFGSEARDLGGIFYQTKGNEAGKNGVYGASKECSWVCKPSDVNLKEMEIK